jgi:pimeloyl-ACP methyl ester carboxylesterase
VATIDRARIHILGLSNGGLAISQLATRQGSQFASITYISPVFDTGAIRSDSFATQCRERRVLVVTGSTDDRIPLGYVEENSARMTRAGAKVTLKTFDGADHFLIFSHHAQLLQVVEEWFRTGG